MWGRTDKRSKPKEYVESTEPQQAGASSRSSAERYGSGGGWEAHEGSASTSQDQAKEILENIQENRTELTTTIQRLKAMQMDNLKPFVSKLEALRFQLNRNHLTETGAQKTYAEIERLILQTNDKLTQEQRLIRQAWEKLHNNDKGDAWKAIENQGWTITSQGPYRFELTCDQEQQLSIADAQAFLRERIADNLTAKIQDGLIEHLANQETPEQDKGLLRKALAVMSDPANRGKGCYECGNVTVRLYQLQEVKTRCIFKKGTKELYVVNNALYGAKIFDIPHRAIGESNKKQLSYIDGSIYEIGQSNTHFLKETKKINVAIMDNFGTANTSKKQINIAIDENNTIYLFDNKRMLSQEHSKNVTYYSEVMQGKKNDEWSPYTITGFEDNE